VINGTGTNVDGTAATEIINGTANNNWITPGGGSDTVDGGGGDDMVSFFDLPDTPGRTNLDYRLDIDLSTGSAVSHDGAERVTLIDVERITGTIFADRIKGDAGDNALRGLGDYDWFIATEGNDSYEGGTGRDTVSYAEAGAGVIVDLGAGRGLAGMAAGDSYDGIERITGSGFADTFYGDGGENGFRGLGGYDTFVGSAGGRERYDGGSGLDTVTYFQSAAGVTASLLLGYGSGGDAARDLYTSIENLTGSGHGDVLTGDHGRNILRGLSGDDFLFGNGGVDYLTGGGGDDTIDGGAGSDYALFSGDRADYTLARSGNQVTVSGADGTDLLTDVEYFRFDDQDVTIWSL
jgi:Ca2+-binding RTX toxin-like protein